MRILYFGSNKVSKLCVEKLLAMGHEIVGIFTVAESFEISYSDRPVKNVLYEDISEFAAKHGIPVYKTSGKLIKDGYDSIIKDINPDFILIFPWYHLVPEKIIKIPSKGTALLHPSLLPEYRGGAPVPWAMINGEKRTGVSLFYLTKEIDAGDIIGQKMIGIEEEDDISTIFEKIYRVTLDLLEEYIPLIESNKVVAKPQDLKGSKVWPQRKPEDGLIDWNQSNNRIYNWIRALTKPYPGAFTLLDGKKMFIWKASKVNEIPNFPPNSQNGHFDIHEGKVFVKCSEGFIRIDEIDYEEQKGVAGSDLPISFRKILGITEPI